MKKQTVVIISGLAILAIFIAGAIGFKKYQAKKYGFLAQNNASTFVRDYSPQLGSDSARVFLVKFSDPACETCSAFHPAIKKLMADYPDKIKLVIRYAPFHDGADFFVKILEASRKQDKFWDALDMMYKTQPYWASHHDPRPDRIWKYLTMAGIDIKKIRADMNNPEFERRIEQDLADAKTLDVRKTPGFFVNGKPLTSFGYPQLRQLIESEIKENY